MRHVVEWRISERGMEVGDIILQRVLFPPLMAAFGLEFYVRITAIFKERQKWGFAYETLSGHVEKGSSEFYFEVRETGIYFTIRTFSEPQFWLARATKHIFALPYQSWCTQCALAYVRSNFVRENGLKEEA